MAITFAIVIVSGMLFAFRGGEVEKKKEPYADLKQVSASTWSALSKKKIYFGHQSVGFNILDGIRDIMKDNPQIKLNIVETTKNEDVKDGIFAHSRIGKNSEPISKVDSFSKIMASGFGTTVDVAFMKFCYVDFSGKTDVAAVFSAYKTKMTELEKKYPEATFIHLSVPLTVTKENWKTTLKKLLGKNNIWEYSDNIKRNEMNEMISEEYGKDGNYFDLAKFESTHPDGKRETFSHKNNKYSKLIPEYAYDVGHLNEIGRRKVAEQLLLFLVNLDR